MGRRSGGSNYERDGALVGRRDTYILDAAVVVLNDPAALIEREFAVVQVPIGIGQPARVIASTFLIGFRHQDHIAMQGDVLSSQPRDRLSKHRQTPLEIDRTPAPYVAIPNHTGKGIGRPLLPFDPDDIGMRGQQHRLLRAIALETRDEVSLSRLRSGHDVNVKTKWAKTRSQKFGNLVFVPGRIRGVDANQFREQIGGLGFGRLSYQTGTEGRRCQEESRDLKQALGEREAWADAGRF